MIRTVVTFVAIALLSITQAHAQKTLDEVIGEPVTVEGMTAAQIGDRAMQCLQSASANAADKVVPLRDGDSTYAIVVTGFSKMLVEFMARSRMTVQAKDGRFRIVHSQIEQFVEFTHGWGPIYMHAGGGAKQAKAALDARSAAVADCITKKVEQPGGDW